MQLKTTPWATAAAAGEQYRATSSRVSAFKTMTDVAVMLCSVFGLLLKFCSELVAHRRLNILSFNGSLKFI
jgi:hypothetical protein